MLANFPNNNQAKMCCYTCLFYTYITQFVLTRCLTEENSYRFVFSLNINLVSIFNDTLSLILLTKSFNFESSKTAYTNSSIKLRSRSGDLSHSLSELRPM